jgi:short-subunit dehydrogenase
MASTTILVTGASSGIGAALAKAYAAPATNLVLWGRDAGRLAQTARECQNLGSTVQTLQLDLRNIAEIAGHIREFDRMSPIDIAILNAGLGGAASVRNAVESAERSLDVATVNFTAAIVGATAVAECMAGRRRGHIVLITSVADTIPLPMAPTYAASKAGLKMFAESLAIGLERQGIKVTVVSPGFVDTAMSRQVQAPKPFMVSAEAAAATIKRGLEQRRKHIVVPWPYGILSMAFRLLPGPLRRTVLRVMPKG